MDAVLTVLGAFAGVAAGGFLGFTAGDRVVRGRAWLYWTANVVGGLACVAIAGVGLARDWSFLWIGGLALLGTWITGLKYGYARNPGARAIRDGIEAGRRSKAG